MPDDENVRIVVTVVLEKDGDGYHAYAPAFKGLHIDGDTEEHALDRVREAINVYCASLDKHGERLQEGPGLTIRRAAKTYTLQWPSTHPSGINSRTALQAI